MSGVSLNQEPGVITEVVCASTFKGFSSGAATAAGWLVPCSGFFARPRLLPCASFKSLRGKNSACVSMPGVWPTYHVYCEARSALPSTLFLRCVLLVDLRRSITSHAATHARCEMHHTTVLVSIILYKAESPRRTDGSLPRDRSPINRQRPGT